MYPVHSEVVSPSNLLRFVLSGDDHIAAVVTSMFSGPILRRSGIEDYLRHTNAAKRLHGLARATIELAWATDPECARALIGPLRSILDERLAGELRMTSNQYRDIRNSVLSAAAFAALQTGARRRWPS
jgi:hypothetical protein